MYSRHPLHKSDHKFIFLVILKGLHQIKKVHVVIYVIFYLFLDHVNFFCHCAFSKSDYFKNVFSHDLKK